MADRREPPSLGDTDETRWCPLLLLGHIPLLGLIQDSLNGLTPANQWG